ncbi:MAG: hypothetical protein PWQ96_1303 [Clostridia bacterium]|nr:hypothetical protein [Clostridia bacterium]
MSNLYVWFPNGKERRDFVKELLEIGPIVPKSESLKALKETEKLKKDLILYLDMLDEGKTKSPYYELHKLFYMGIIPDVKQKLKPWAELEVFKKGFRRIYTQKSYFFRSGYWLILQFRENKAGREKRQWVLERIPKARLGLNVPIPMEVICKQKLDWVRKVLKNVTIEQPYKSKDLGKALKYLNRVKEYAPQLFKGENVYLWEQLGWAYNAWGDIEKAEYCLRTQASFQPGCNDAFLNLGVFFAERGQWKKAIAAYVEGLKVNPKDEFIYFNLAALYRDEGKRDYALKMLNNAIIENPQRGLNYKLKGDIHHDAGEYEAALSNYKKAVKLLDDGWESIKIECYLKMASIYKKSNEFQMAANVLETAYNIENSNTQVLIQLALLYAKNLNQWKKAKKYAEQALDFDPYCSKACFILAEYYELIGEIEKTKWYLKRGKRMN